MDMNKLVWFFCGGWLIVLAEAYTQAAEKAAKEAADHISGRTHGRR